ncbi:hypothetical protein B0J13DRAFT_283492 [Dactylonectria estremocensis]|uniref:Sulphur transport domain-containing protein n=1 Tax=Dactylonectria estremocensis TaxID=1079267 RepID=A0A9P9J4W7_9HYPO|nr:hypothetical protein B0J13DRAFT_283492 [Dactylonectria estremocensis]
MTTLLSGAVFGASTVAAGIVQPSTIISQFKFEDFHMLQVFIGATASSAIIYKVAESLGYVSLKPRSSSPLGLFSQYDGNIIGGSLLGLGMGISGSCPGTLFAQAGLGLQTGLYTLGGAIIGGIVHVGIVAKIIKWQKERTGVTPHAVTLDEQLGVSKNSTLLLFEAVALSVVVTSVVFTNGSPDWTLFSAGSGLFLGFAQLFSILTRRSMLGVSTSFEEIGNQFLWLLRGANPNSWPSGRQNIIFAAGAALGSWVLAHNFPSLAEGSGFETAPGLAITGGFLMAIGSRIAGGCTSGHGVSGLSLLSTSSLITIVSLFAAGGLVAPLVHK